MGFTSLNQNKWYNHTCFFIWTGLSNVAHGPLVSLFNNPLSLIMLCIRLVEIDPVNFVFSLLILVIKFPWKRTLSFIWTKMSPLHPSMLCAKFAWNKPSRFLEEFWMSSNHFVIIYPEKCEWSVIWTKMSLLHPNVLCPKSC